MAASRWERIEELFEQASRMSAASRLHFLSQACAGDETLRLELEMMVTTRAPLAIERLAPGGRPAPVVPDPMLGTLVGHWRLVGLLGRGGMGTVYRVERADGQYQQQGALKLVSRDLFRASDVQRFRNERQLLARLQHPNIARLMDGGSAPDGRPYLVMELIDGAPITAWSRARNLSVDERLRLFRTVCEAVEHAHAALVVHRDLKPANIFVSSTGQVKLLDFGIAKLLDPDTDGRRATLTQDGAAALTPQYAAPEQFGGRPITAATDVYALGVVLHELLTDQHPTRPATGSPAAWMKAVLDAEPQRMSRVVPPGKLRRLLQGDLDTIVAKALKKRPLERYRSAGALAEDLGRSLAHRPISARPDGLGYRAGRFVQRNRLAVVAAALTAGSLTIAVGAAYRAQVISAGQTAETRERAARLARAADPADAPMRGKPNAPVTIVEFTAFDCGSCAIVHGLLTQISSAYPDEVRVVAKVVSLNKDLAAEAALAAHEQGMFWRMHERLFSGQDLSRPSLEAHAAALGLDLGMFRAALDSRKFLKTVQTNSKLVQDVLGLAVTPWLVINGEPLLLHGERPLDDLRRRIDRALDRP